MKVAIFGAGTMGSGIAQVFAAKGHTALMYASSVASAQKHKDKLAASLAKRVAKGKMTQEAVDALLANILVEERSACADADLRAAVTTANLPFAVELNSDEPQVLILHTHATETYQTWPDLLYDRSAAARTRNTALNMCAVGARMAEVLNAAGIHTLHDETLHDFPSYTESYDRSRATAQEYLRQYPSIKVVLDVHRDAIEDADGTLVKPVCTIDGASTAQVMIIAGCDNGSTISLPNWRLNLRFAAAWEEAMESRFPGLTRPVLCGYRFYNQDLTTGSLLIEIGGHGNTLEEALRAGEFAALALAELLGRQQP